VFLLDIRVDPIDGFEMLKLLQNNPDYADSLFVAITASVMNDEVDKLKDAGFDGGISKPIKQREFPDQMKALLSGESVWLIG
jgi:two-component system cell cycle response regulator DivK